MEYDVFICVCLFVCFFYLIGAFRREEEEQKAARAWRSWLLETWRIFPAGNLLLRESIGNYLGNRKGNLKGIFFLHFFPVMSGHIFPNPCRNLLRGTIVVYHGVPIHAFGVFFCIELLIIHLGGPR